LRSHTLILAALGALLVLIVVPSFALAATGGVCAECDDGAGGDGEEGAGGANSQLSLAELRGLARRVGFAKPTVAAAIAMAESSGQVRAINRNPKPRRSVDRGLFQINSRWHPEVSRRCAFEARCNARAALRISDGGRDWRQWTTWHSHAYEAYL